MRNQRAQMTISPGDNFLCGGIKPHETNPLVNSRPQESLLTYSVPRMSKPFPNSLNFKGVLK